MSINEYSIATIDQFIGRELGVSDWVVVDQERIDVFAACTGDRQWIHTDVERARLEGPFGGTIAHGYLTLSLLAALSIEIGLIPPDASAGLNYGLDKVRFMTPVKAGARVRNRATLVSVEKKGGGRLIVKTMNELQIDGEDKPALVAETLAMLVA
jgi:acyl dehydratase